MQKIGQAWFKMWREDRSTCSHFYLSLKKNFFSLFQDTQQSLHMKKSN